LSRLPRRSLRDVSHCGAQSLVKFFAVQDQEVSSLVCFSMCASLNSWIWRGRSKQRGGALPSFRLPSAVTVEETPRSRTVAGCLRVVESCGWGPPVFSESRPVPVQASLCSAKDSSLRGSPNPLLCPTTVATGNHPRIGQPCRGGQCQHRVVVQQSCALLFVGNSL
jgi:hypothetical protein